MPREFPRYSSHRCATFLACLDRMQSKSVIGTQTLNGIATQGLLKWSRCIVSGSAVREVGC